MLFATPIFLLEMPGGMEWIWIVLAIIILFGGKKIPELAKGVGKGIREFKDAKDGIKKKIEDGMNEGDSKATTSQQESRPTIQSTKKVVE